MNAVSIVVASKYRDIFDQCRGGVDALTGEYRKFVIVDDPENWNVPEWLALQAPLPFRGTASLLNVGIAASSPDDVLWVQDDVTLLDSALAESLRRAAYSQPQAGPVSPIFEGGVGNPLQLIGGGRSNEVIESPTGLAFMCIYFRRDLLNAVGLMDERFTGYAPEDADWCRRAQVAGYNLLIDRSVLARHGFAGETWACTFRRRLGEKCFDTLPEMHRLYQEKWGASAG